jgi:hypothetical protein
MLVWLVVVWIFLCGLAAMTWVLVDRRAASRTEVRPSPQGAARPHTPH